MTQKEVVRTLLDQAKIEPGFTELGKNSYSSSPRQLGPSMLKLINLSHVDVDVCVSLMHFVG